MIISVLNRIDFSPCKSVFALKLLDQNTLPQIAEFNKFANDSDSTSLIINYGYCSLDELDNKIISVAKSAKKNLYIAINKFKIYSNNDQPVSQENTNDYDSVLITHCYDLVKDSFKLVSSTSRIDDHGQLGNFIHPVTTLILKRYD